MISDGVTRAPPADRQPTQPSYAAIRCSVAVSADLSEQLHQVARRSGATLLATTLSSWALLWGRWTGSQDISIGVHVARRPISEDPTVNEFAENFVLQVDLSRQATVAELLSQASVNLTASVGDASISARSEDSSATLSIEASATANDIAELRLLLSLNSEEQRVLVALETASACVETALLAHLMACWQALVDAMATATAHRRSIHELPLLSAEERMRVLYQFNDTATIVDERMLLHTLFEAQARRTPGVVALRYEQRRVTYAQLDALAEQWASLLVDAGVRPECVVGVCAERSIEMVAGVLGVLKAGGAILLLDPSYPAERLAYMLSDASPLVVLTQRRLVSALPETSAQVIALEDEHVSGDSISPAANLPRQQPKPTNLAYVIYTSGSTGRPKGVLAEHRGMVNRIAAQSSIAAYRNDDIGLQKTSIGFVDSIFEIFGPLSYGATLVLLGASTHDLDGLVAEIETARVTRLVSVPSLARSWVESGKFAGTLRSLRTWTLSGEELTRELLAKLRERLPSCQFVNLYGSSEVAADVTYYVDQGDDRARVPIGRPIENMQIYILDANRQPVPVGMIGEIHVGGVGVARGYLNQHELTAERFLDDPFGRSAEARLYKSGDLGRWLPDGSIEYHGRNDRQVKLRGFRIELGEIEAQLQQHAQVTQAAVVVAGSPDGGERLVAYVTPRGARPSVADLRDYLWNHLPHYMVPAAFTVLDRLPLTQSGKVDRGALPSPELSAFVSREYQAPQGHIEQLLASLWQKMLGVQRVGRLDSFFELGGHSLLIVHISERLREAGLNLEVRQVFGSPRLADLAARMAEDMALKVDSPPDAADIESESGTPVLRALVELDDGQIQSILSQVPGGVGNVQDIYPLAPLQEGMLFHHLLSQQRGGGSYVTTTLLELSACGALTALISVLQHLIDRHDVLRTALFWDNLPKPVQVVYRKAILPVDTLELDAGRDPARQMQELLGSMAPRMDLTKAPLMRLLTAVDSTSGKGYALLQTHHVIEDDTSLKILISEIVALLGQRELPPAEPGAYRRHVAWILQRERQTDSAGFFRKKLSDVDETTAPFSVLDVHGDGGQLALAETQFDSPLSSRIRVQARSLGVTAATLFHAAWSLVVATTTGRDDVVFGTVLLGRRDSRPTVGMFINTLPLRINLSGQSADQLVQQVQSELAELLAFEQASLAVAQRSSGISGGAPLFSCVLNYRNNVIHLPKDQCEAVGLRVLGSADRVNYPLTLSIDDGGERFDLVARADGRIDPQRILEYTHTAMVSLVGALERSCRTQVLALTVLPAQERARVVGFFNETEADFPKAASLQRLFEDQVRRTPDAVALVYECGQLTYAELNGAANRLARYLIRQGVRIGECVAVLMPRCAQLPIAQLAVLKSGGVYVPVDYELPPERQQFILGDCAARWILGGRPAFTSERWQWIDGFAPEAAGQDLHVDDLDLPLDEVPPAYVMYTSGSTGMPKGVIVPHRAVSRLALNNGYARILSTDRIAHCSNPVFDASTFEIWGAWLNGASVLVVPQSVLLEPLRFAEALTSYRVTVLWLTVGLLSQYTEALSEVFRGLRYLITGGDIVEPSVVARILRNPPQNFLNAYGPTECTTFATTYLLAESDERIQRIPIGRPISNTRVYILGTGLQPVPVGVFGEIYIGGAGVAHGYLNRPELTAERFLADPFSNDYRMRLYKTGDLGRWLADGNVEFLGRNDRQVKVRGFRIELGEVEAQLARYGSVREAIVNVQEYAPGDKRLVAYISARDRGGLGIEALREYAKTALPDYMIPAAFVLLDSFPLTATGKVDRRALPAPDLEAYVTRPYEPPAGEVEQILARIWREVLGVRRVGRDDHFFELGGHSLLAMQVRVRLRSLLSIEVPIGTLFESPTLRALAIHVERLREAGLLDELQDASLELRQLVEQVAEMSESGAQELAQQLRVRS